MITRIKKYLIAIGIMLVVVVGTYVLFFSGKSSQNNQSAGQVERIVKVTRGDLNLTVSSDGVVQPINKVEIRSKAGGKIVQLNIIEGQYVNEGDLLILVDQTTTKNNLDQVEADLETAQANLVQAQNNDKRSQELFSKELVSQQEIDQSNTDLVRAQAQLVKAKAALSTAKDQMNDTRIVAPVSGIILSKSVELGQIISSAMSNVGGGTILATVADMNAVYVYAKVDEVDIGKVKVGQKAGVIADAYPDDMFLGKVERIAPQGITQQNVTTFDVIILVKNEGWKLKAGMSASVDIQVFNRVNVILIPNEALKDPKSEQGMELMVEANLTIPEDNPVVSSEQGKNVDGNAGRQKKRERFKNMSPEEREKARNTLRQKVQQDEGVKLSDAGMQTTRPRRLAQVSNENDVRWRVVVIKEGKGFKPRLVKTGPSNFDNTEIIEGLSEGDEIQILSISRAKIASERLTERIRSSSSLGGVPAGGGRVGGGGRDH